MICSRYNMSISRTCSFIVSIIQQYMDTLCGRVHNVDMNERTETTVKLDHPIMYSLKELGDV